MARDIAEFNLQKAIVIFLEGNRDSQTGLWRKPPALAPNVVYWHNANNGARGEESAAKEMKFLKELGMQPGAHDMMFLRPTLFTEGTFGLLFCMELKRPGGTQPPERQLSKSQQVFHPRILRAGAAASVVIDNLDDAKAWLIKNHLAMDC